MNQKQRNDLLAAIVTTASGAVTLAVVIVTGRALNKRWTRIDSEEMARHNIRHTHEMDELRARLEELQNPDSQGLQAL